MASVFFINYTHISDEGFCRLIRQQQRDAKLPGDPRILLLRWPVSDPKDKDPVRFGKMWLHGPLFASPFRELPPELDMFLIVGRVPQSELPTEWVQAIERHNQAAESAIDWRTRKPSGWSRQPHWIKVHEHAV